MANRYWVGGNNIWDNSTSRWSATSGGSGGASVPGVNDDVFFPSGTNTVRMNSNKNVKSINFTGFNGTFTSDTTTNGWTLLLRGSLTLSSGMTFTPKLGYIRFEAGYTGTLTTNGKNLPCDLHVYGTVTLGSALTLSTGLATTPLSKKCVYVGNDGSFTSAGFAISADAFIAPGAAPSVVNLGASNITLQGDLFDGYLEGIGYTSNIGQVLQSGTGAYSATSGTITINGSTTRRRILQIPTSALNKNVTVTSPGVLILNNFSNMLNLNIGSQASMYFDSGVFNLTGLASGAMVNAKGLRYFGAAPTVNGLKTTLTFPEGSNGVHNMEGIIFNGIDFVNGSVIAEKSINILDRCNGLTVNSPPSRPVVIKSALGPQHMSDGVL